MTAQVETPLEEHNREWNLAAARIAAVLSAVLTLGGWVLDWVLHPALVWDFLVIRGIAASLALATILLTPASWAKRYSQLLFFLPIFIAALAVQVMIEFLGGYASTYYAGLNLCVLGFAVTVRVPTRIAAAASMSIIALWLFPALIRPGPIAFGPFFNNLFFLIGTASIATASSELHYRLARREFEAQHELESANHQLRELHETRSRFFANITHELRTPLTLILAPLEDLLLRHSKDKMHGEFEAMHRNGMRLLRQINALLDLARVDAGQFRLRVDEIKLDTLLESTFSSFQAIARRKKVDLRLEGVRPGVTLHGDQEKLDLVFTNLLANAVKFTPEGGQITLGIETDTDWVSISVRDSGIGIPQDQLERIFDRFAQVDSGTNRRYEGAGIGLSLVKEVVEMHRGQVTVSSVLGQGTEFVIRLRRGAMSFPDGVIDRRRVDIPKSHTRTRRAEDRDVVAWVPVQLNAEAYISVKHDGSSASGLPAVAKPPTTSHGRILLVEDNADMQSYLGRRLTRNYELQVCANGREALELIKLRPPDLVLSDVMMPEMSGYELCKVIKEDPVMAAVPVILLTARKGVDRTLEGFKCGADDYLTKPFNYQELEARIEVQLKLSDATRRLAEQEKRAVLSVVAAGLAHEVRNPVNAILNAARPLLQIAADSTEESADIAARRELLEVIIDAATRVDTLVGDLLGVARDNPEEVAPWQVSDAITSAERLLRYKHGKLVSLNCRFEHQSAVVGRTSQLNQVLMNLLDNAMRAAGDEGQVWVDTAQQNGTLTLRVRDSGVGIAPDVVHRVFDPLFSTHDSPDATGLGLHVSKRIVEQHRGKISAKSNCEKGGAEFIVELPIQP